LRSTAGIGRRGVTAIERPRRNAKIDAAGIGRGGVTAIGRPRAWRLPPVIVPELFALALPPATVTALKSPVSLPVLVAVALPPAVVAANAPPKFVPELVSAALPPPVVSDSKALAVPLLVVVALAFRFWPACGALLRKKVGCVPELVQVLSVGVTVHMNCAEAGETDSSDTAAAQQKGVVEANRAATQRRAWPANRRCPVGVNPTMDSVERELRLRTGLPRTRPTELWRTSSTVPDEKLCSTGHDEQNQESI
jgi:hypothetical protein